MKEHTLGAVEIVSPKEAQEILHVGKTKLYTMIARGELPAKKLGGSTVILMSDIRRFVANLPSANKEVQ